MRNNIKQTQKVNEQLIANEKASDVAQKFRVNLNL